MIFLGGPEMDIPTLIRGQAPTILVVLCLLIRWHTKIPHSVDLWWWFGASFFLVGTICGDVGADSEFVQVLHAKDRNFLELYAGRAEVTKALRAAA